ncbi:MAG: tetraacyldisaccharide 4'-kinase [Candidatus Endobugula sp.]|jgi:tetraacyldisaccharide 4'-kinase
MANSQQTSWLQSFFLDMWYGKCWWVRIISWLLLPLAWFYQLLAYVNQRWQKKQSTRIAVPVVVVGNISVGGTGKTPIIIALANALTAKHIQVGIISRGYGSNAPYYPHFVTVDDQATQCGDEPLLIAKATQCPVMISQNRVAAAQQLLASHPEVQLILSDDGLQHHRLQRNVEIVVVDSERGLGNHFCLPAGPLREPAKRLSTVDWILLNTPATNELKQEHVQSQSQEKVEIDRRLPIKVSLQPQAWRHVASQEVYPLTPYPWLDGEVNRAGANAKALHAVAGIGHPQRFFNTLTQLGIDNSQSSQHSFDDHHQFITQDFSAWTNDTVLMTEKDGVKCQALIGAAAMPDDCWALIVDIDLPNVLIEHVESLVNSSS